MKNKNFINQIGVTTPSGTPELKEIGVDGNHVEVSSVEGITTTLTEAAALMTQKIGNMENDISNLNTQVKKIKVMSETDYNTLSTKEKDTLYLCW